MKVYGLVGKSGTGKSYQSMRVCKEWNIESIIDDGLFIYANAVQAGHSAKRDENKMTAIKTAIFNEEKDRTAVAEKIKQVQPESILVLGTSEGMIRKICSRLELPEVSEMIHIEDIVDQDAIATALRQRREKGKHVIPVPQPELKRQFSGYFMTPLKVFRQKNGKTFQTDEKTVVRPTYSYYGKHYISEKVVIEIIQHVGADVKGVVQISKCGIKTRQQGVTLNIAAIFEYSRNLRKIIENLQRHVTEEVENMTAFNVVNVNVVVKGLSARGYTYGKK